MRHVVPVVLLALCTAALAADAPQFKSPAVRQAHQKYEGARNGYRMALERGIAQAEREGDEAEADKLRAHLEALQSEATPTGTEALATARSLVGTRWLWNGGPLQLTINRGTLSLSDWNEPAAWRPVNQQTIRVDANGEEWRITVEPGGKHLFVVTAGGKVRVATRL